MSIDYFQTQSFRKILTILIGSVWVELQRSNHEPPFAAGQRDGCFGPGVEF
jgi:hypothetical protein